MLVIPAIGASTTGVSMVCGPMVRVRRFAGAVSAAVAGASVRVVGDGLSRVVIASIVPSCPDGWESGRG